jgi:hypothetical protein
MSLERNSDRTPIQDSWLEMMCSSYTRDGLYRYVELTNGLRFGEKWSALCLPYILDIDLTVNRVFCNYLLCL